MRAILLALAALAPSGAERPPALSVPTEWFRWLPLSAVRLFSPFHPAAPLDNAYARVAVAPTVPGVSIERGFGERLAALDQIRAERPIRVGWLWVAGRVKPDQGSGRSQRIFHPLVTAPVRVQRVLGTAQAYQSRWGDRRAELVVDLAGELGNVGGGLSPAKGDEPVGLAGGGKES